MKTKKQAEKLLSRKEHLLDGKTVDCKWAVPPESPALSPVTKSRKVFVGGIPYDLTKSEFTEYFVKFGEIEDCIIMLDKTTGNPRGFGFVTFNGEDAAEKVLDQYDKHYIKGKWVEVKIATPKESISTEDSSDCDSTERQDPPSPPKQSPPQVCRH
jgi:RNA recognition motif-containing protein